MKAIYQVTAHYDDETERSTAMSDDIPGLICEAGDMHELKATIKELAPLLLDLNGLYANINIAPLCR